MGLAGLRQLGVRSGESFNVEAELPLQVPYSCVIDGLQISTKCTVGNRKLTAKNSQRVEASFRKEDRKVIVTLNHQVLMRLRSRIAERHATDLELQEMALKLASIPIDELMRTRASS